MVGRLLVSNLGAGLSWGRFWYNFWIVRNSLLIHIFCSSRRPF